MPNDNQNPDHQQDFFPCSGSKTPQIQPWELLSQHGGPAGDRGSVLALPRNHLEISRSLAVFNITPINCAASQPCVAEGQGEKMGWTLLFISDCRN